ncbi:MAG: DNA helicase UvrBC [Planctomycetota bacterium]|nr:MAG: DNA helicase UvrBC [Planctomycetota bacterium]
MKCQQCDNPAVFHITELESGSVRELHLCEDHARTYLNQNEDAGGGSEGGGAPKKGVGQSAGGPLGVGQTADDLAALDQRVCEMCGITFFEFRNQGRLGCPHDYIQFEKELEPLIANIHGATEHTGRRPSRAVPAGADPAVGTDGLTEVIGLRRGMKEAIASEDYEKASENRDAIRGIEDRWVPPLPSGQSPTP